MSASNHVVVVGAGTGGLTAALALLKRGIDVEVYEQSDRLKEVGAGIQISSNGTRVLFALGLEAALAQVQVRPERRELRHWSTGERPFAGGPFRRCECGSELRGALRAWT
jgi:2-polyprenyl-6-methoxyphenol hydroxylase-like FAD-dependent oxidoreductase